MAKQKKQPLRKCVISQEMLSKKELIRVVRNKDGEVFIDETGKQNGRGAYLSRDGSTIERAKQTKALNRHLNTNVDESLYDELLQHVSESS